MELRQLRYFVRVVELGSMGRAAADLGVVTSTLSQQISRLEGELATRLLQRTSTGIVPTDAGLAFWRQAQLVLRHAQGAAQAAQVARLSGRVSVGLAPTTASVLGMPLLAAMRERYPDIHLHLVEAMSGHLAALLNSRQLDLAILFHADAGRRWSVMPLLDEHLFLLALPGFPAVPSGPAVRLAGLAKVDLILPSGPHGLRATIDAGFARTRIKPRIVAEIDSLAMLMNAVGSGYGATIQPGAATARLRDTALSVTRITDPRFSRRNLLASLSDDELSPAALAVRVVLAQVASTLVRSGRWTGATLQAAATLHEN